MSIDIAIGLAMGVVAGALFFAGLAAGLRVALGAARPGAVLLVSAALRIALLLGAGWAAAQMGAAVALSFAAGFIMIRVAALAWARRTGREA
jgi:F1F0 ATPase subunit 2